MRLLDIYHISHTDFTISIGVQYSLSWIDNRMILLGNKSFVNLDVDFINKLWVMSEARLLLIFNSGVLQVPDLYIYDLKRYRNRETIRPQIGVSVKKNSDEALGNHLDKTDFVI